MEKIKVVEAEIIDNKIVKNFSSGNNRLQFLKVRLPDDRIHEEDYLTPERRIEMSMDDTRFKTGETIEVELDLGQHSREHVYDHLDVHIKRIIIPK